MQIAQIHTGRSWNKVIKLLSIFISVSGRCFALTGFKNPCEVAIIQISYIGADILNRKVGLG